jgi:hypothetical protein
MKMWLLIGLVVTGGLFFVIDFYVDYFRRHRSESRALGESDGSQWFPSFG